jgi:membrane peptidoglycan carboxypeptidase
VTRTISQRLGLLLVISVVAGLLMAGMLLPVVGGAGLATKSAVNSFESLPSDLKQLPLPQVSKVVAANGDPIATFFSQDRRNVPLSEIPKDMQLAIISIEDVRFYEHNGVDPKGTLRALLHNTSSDSAGTQGGSTLTQQLVKNILVEDARTPAQRRAATSDTLARKVREAKFALELERQYTKAEILNRYLNIAYFGDGAYGVGAAALHYFDESVSKLTLPQSAMLAGLVQSPDAYNPRLHPQTARLRRDTVLGQMQKYHFITPEQYDAASAKPVKLHVHQQSNGCTTSPYPYFCDYVVHYALPRAVPKSVLRAGGLTVTTTLSTKVQNAAQQAIAAYVHPKEASHVAGAEAVVQPGTGQVKALAVSTKYGNNAKKGENSIDYAVDQKEGGWHGAHAGSTFKLFVLAAALKEGIPITTQIPAPGSTVITGYTNCAGDPLGSYPVHNDEPGDGGSNNLETGTWFSVNTFYAGLEKRTGVCEPVKLAEAMGVKQGTGAPPEQIPSFVLGSGAQNGFTPLDLAGAYATMAARGKYCPPIVITRIVDRSGHSYPVPKSNCQQVVDQGLADTVTSILRGVLTVHGATGAGLEPGREAAAKTGTVDNFEGSWFAGYTPQLASAVYVGDVKATTESLDGLTIGGRTYGEVFGATLAGPIWQHTMEAALAGVPVIPFQGPALNYEVGTKATVPDVTGQSPESAMSALTQAGFAPEIAGGTVHSTVKAGLVASTSPPGGSQASTGATIQIFVSDGTPPPVKKHKSPASPPPSSSPPKKHGNPVTPPPAHKRHGH